MHEGVAPVGFPPVSLFWLYLPGFGIAFVVGLLVTRRLRERAPALGLLDLPDDERRIHPRATANVGGLGIVAAVFASLLLLLPVAFLVPGLRDAFFAPESVTLYSVLVGAVAMHALGLLDDLRALSPRAKLAGQLAIAVAVFVGGARLTAFHVPSLGMVEPGVWLSLGLTVFWFVAITNAFNLLDGADGLAGGAALVATLAMFVAALVFGHELTALVLVATAGALLAFLHFNFPPASVFLGDGGSLFLGFLLAGAGLATSTKAATAAAIAIPLVAFGLPVLDTLLAITRRFLRGEPISRADRRHVHHRLMELGHSPRRVALILYGVCGAFGLVSLTVLSADGGLIAVAFLLMGVVLWFGVQRLRIPELLELRRVIERGIQQRQVIAANLKMREGAERIAHAESLRAALDALREILGEYPFGEAELWLSAEFLSSPAGAELFPGAAIDGAGYLWSWKRPDLGDSEPSRRSWEVTLPLSTATEEPMGRLTLRRELADPMPAEVQVIADSVLPEVCHAVLRTGRPVTSESWSAVIGRTGADQPDHCAGITTHEGSSVCRAAGRQGEWTDAGRRETAS